MFSVSSRNKRLEYAVGIHISNSTSETCYPQQMLIGELVNEAISKQA